MCLETRPQEFYLYPYIYLWFAQSEDSAIYRVTEEDAVQEQLHFIKFETRYIETCVDFIRSNLIEKEDSLQDKVIKVTGGGAHKYTDLFTKKLGVQ